MTTRDPILREAGKPGPVPADSAAAYRQQEDRLISDVDGRLAGRPEIGSLIGGNPLEVMAANHRHHARFMVNVFRFNHFHLLSRTVPWVYRAYHARGFSYEYFRAELAAWIEAVRKHLEPDTAEPILAVYEWLLDRHEEMVERSRVATIPPSRTDAAWQDVQKAFLASLLSGRADASVDLALRTVRQAADVTGFYLQVIQPCMYEVGERWERGEISVAQEHLATAIASRVMAALYPRFVLGKQTKGKALVSTVAEEFHELGAWMVADLLALDGWDVSYLGANTPTRDLVDMLRRLKPDLLALSSAMPFNLIRLDEVIEAARAQKELPGIRIMVGGRVFRDLEDLWHLTGADGWAPDAEQACLLARVWWEEAGRQ
jgi:methanogenic corrinoid protein MtbC1